MWQAFRVRMFVTRGYDLRDPKAAQKHHAVGGDITPGSIPRL